MQTLEVKITIPGEPVGKGRPRFSRQGAFVRTYTPDKTVSYENLIKVEYERQAGHHFGEKEIGMRVVAYFAIPKSTSRARQERMRNGKILPAKKPDADNVCKVVADALNGVAYTDDKQIVYAEIAKRYGDVPRMEISLFEI